MKTLKEIYKSIIKTNISDKGTLHSYIPYYDQLFHRKRASEKPIKLLEIGIKHGGSLLMWAEYFGKASTIIGIDINQPQNTHFPQNVKTIISNAYSIQTLQILKEFQPFDIIIDDGLHTIETMQFMLINYTHLMKQDGMLIIEDFGSGKFFKDKTGADKVKNSIKKHIPKQYLEHSYFVDFRHIKERNDDFILVINKEGT